MIIDLKAFTVQIIPSKTASFWWRNRYHIRRLWKRWIPWLAMTCDRCGRDISYALDHDDTNGPWWWVGCRRCGIVTTAGSKERAGDRWRQYGGKIFEPEYRETRHV